MNDQFYKSAISSGLASTVCLALAIPLVGIGLLWSISPLMAGIAGVGVFIVYTKATQTAVKVLSELDWNS